MNQNEQRHFAICSRCSLLYCIRYCYHAKWRTIATIALNNIPNTRQMKLLLLHFPIKPIPFLFLALSGIFLLLDGSYSQIVVWCTSERERLSVWHQRLPSARNKNHSNLWEYGTKGPIEWIRMTLNMNYCFQLKCLWLYSVCVWTQLHFFLSIQRTFS